jgi:UDP-glucose:(heptosyl)LPS alpha-1,3-glucosyltransferase
LGPASFKLFGFSRDSRKALAGISPGVDVLGSFGVESPPDGVLWVTSVHKAWLEISQAQRCFRGRLRQHLNPFHLSVLVLERYHFAGRRYRKLIALTDQVKSDLQRLYGVPAGDVEVIPNGFALSEFNIDRTTQVRPTVRQRLGFRESDFVVIFAANELDRKGFEPLLTGMARLDDPNMHLLAVGRLNARRYADRIAELGLSDRVTFTGPTNDVAEYYAAADAFALPTQYEAWGLVIVEAMACGLPVITSRLAGAAVSVVEGRSGYLLNDPGNVEEIAEKLRLVREGRCADANWISTSVGAYEWSQVLLKYERVLYESCLSAAFA